MNDSTNTNLFTVDATGNIDAKETVSGTSLVTTGATGLQIKNGVSVNASINQAGAITCTSLSINGLAVRQYKEIVALNSFKATSATTGSTYVSGWSYSYTGSGGKVKVSVFITCFTLTAPIDRTWTLHKGSTVVATGTFLFNNAVAHTAMPVLTYIDTSGSTSATTWRVAVGAGTHCDLNDTCTMTIAEF